PAPAPVQHVAAVFLIICHRQHLLAPAGGGSSWFCFYYSGLQARAQAADASLESRAALCYTYKIPSLTVVGRKNRCILCTYWATAIFVAVANYSNLFLSLTFFLDRSHFTFGYELVVCPETADVMKVICNPFPSIQWDEPLLLYFGEIHCFQCIQQFLTGIF